MCQMDVRSTGVAVVDAVSIPVTVKMRLGWDDDSLTAPDLARALRAGGVAGVIVPAALVSKGSRGSVNRAGIGAVVDAVEADPVVANGDIRTEIADAAATFEETGCAAVSIGRGSLANPFCFVRYDSIWSRTATRVPTRPSTFGAGAHRRRSPSFREQRIGVGRLRRLRPVADQRLR